MSFRRERPRAVAALRIAALAIAVPAFALTGCGSAPATLTAARPAAARPPGDMSAARHFGLRLFSGIVLPPGARQLARDPAPSVLGAGVPGIAAPYPGD